MEGGGQTIHTRCHPLRAAEAAASRRRKPPLLAAAASRRRMPPEPAAAAMQQVRSKPPLRREGPRGPVEVNDSALCLGDGGAAIVAWRMQSDDNVIVGCMRGTVGARGAASSVAGAKCGGCERDTAARACAMQPWGCDNDGLATSG